MHKKQAWILHTFICCMFMYFAALILGGCQDKAEHNIEETGSGTERGISRSLSYRETLQLQYAENFSVDYYEGEYALISVSDGRKYLVVPEGKQPPEDLEKEILILQKPMTHIYLAATAVMDMFCTLDGLDFISFSSQSADGWSMEEVQRKMQDGNILYAGKYSMPDYELILSDGCSLAIENNMISHSPEVVEKLESFGIPVLIDLSSYENHPLGRVEWIKLYGVLLDREKEACQAFDRQCEAVAYAAQEEPAGKTVAFFFITENGMANVRVSSDYIPKMIELAGGKYIFENLGNEKSRRSSMTMQMEEFYHAAKDADYLIYNSTIDGQLESIEQLLQKENLLGEFKAVQEGNVWCTTRDLYQQSMSIGQMIEDIHNMMLNEPERQKDMKYLYQLNDVEVKRYFDPYDTWITPHFMPP